MTAAAGGAAAACLAMLGLLRWAGGAPPRVGGGCWVRGQGAAGQAVGRLRGESALQVGGLWHGRLLLDEGGGAGLWEGGERALSHPAATAPCPTQSYPFAPDGGRRSPPCSFSIFHWAAATDASRGGGGLIPVRGRGGGLLRAGGVCCGWDACSCRHGWGWRLSVRGGRVLLRGGVSCETGRACCCCGEGRPAAATRAAGTAVQPWRGKGGLLFRSGPTVGWTAAVVAVLLAGDRRAAAGKGPYGGGVRRLQWGGAAYSKVEVAATGLGEAATWSWLADGWRAQQLPSPPHR